MTFAANLRDVCARLVRGCNVVAAVTVHADRGKTVAAGKDARVFAVCCFRKVILMAFLARVVDLHVYSALILVGLNFKNRCVLAVSAKHFRMTHRT